MPSATIGSYGWHPSLPDARDDLAFPAGLDPSLQIPEVFSLRTELPLVLDQLQLGSCTANALAGILQYAMMLSGVASPTEADIPSRLFIYYQERLREGTISTDAGAIGRDGFAALRKLGCPREVNWPYLISLFRSKPSEIAYEGAAWGRISNYTHARHNLAEVQALILQKKPVAFGFNVPRCFESEGVMAHGVMPATIDVSEGFIGGHEVYAMGWKPGYVECRNSWGADVMDHGNFWIPNSFIFGGYASDFRAIGSLAKAA